MPLSRNSTTDAISWLFDKLETEPDFLQASFTLPPSIILSLARSFERSAVPGGLPSKWLNIEEVRQRLRQAANQSPEILPLVLLGAIEGKFDPTLRVGTAVKIYFHAHGVTQSGWSYLCRHGSQIFRTPWVVAANGPSLAAAASFLRMLQSAGLPPPPPEELVLAWLQSYTPEMAGLLDLEEWRPLESPEVIRAAFAEAHRRRNDHDFPSFIETFLGVSSWARSVKPRFDRNRRRRGWKWIESRWKKWESAHRRNASSSTITWESLVPPFETPEYRIRPLLTPLEMFDEGVAMRNCVGKLVVECSNDQTRIFSLTRKGNGKRVAHVRIYLFNEKWQLYDVRGFANRPATATEIALGQEIAGIYESSSAPHLAVADTDVASVDRATGTRDLDISLYEFGTLIFDDKLPKKAGRNAPAQKPDLHPRFDLEKFADTVTKQAIDNLNRQTRN